MCTWSLRQQELEILNGELVRSSLPRDQMPDAHISDGSELSVEHVARPDRKNIRHDQMRPQPSIHIQRDTNVRSFSKATQSKSDEFTIMRRQDETLSHMHHNFCIASSVRLRSDWYIKESLSGD